MCRHRLGVARRMTGVRATALAGSLCLHGALLALVLRPSGPGMPGPDAGGEAGGIFSTEPAEPPGAPEPADSAAASSLPDLVEDLPAPQEPIRDSDLIVPLDPGLTHLPAATQEKHRAATSGGGRMAKPPGAGNGKGRGNGGGGRGGGMYVAPSYLNNPAPDYPREARASRHEGIVLLEVVVNEQGRAAKVEVLRSSGDVQLDRAAMAAVSRWTFNPATAGGRPVAAQVEVPVRFRLR